MNSPPLDRRYVIFTQFCSLCSGDERGQANSNSPPKPGMNDKAPPKDGQSDQPGQENQAKKPGAEKGEMGDQKGTEKGDASKGDTSEEEKSDSDQGKPGENKPSDKPGDQKDSSKSEDAKKIDDLIKQMKNGVARTREQARKELEVILDTKIYLGLYVKVAPDWRENPQKVRELDWRHQLEELTPRSDEESTNEE